MSGADKADGKDVARVSVRILDKEYLVACPFEERSALLDAAQHLDTRMREVRDTGKVVGIDRIAVIAALNLANELLRVQSREKRAEAEAGGRVRALRERIDGALARGQQLDL
ncbi:MAG: cell division protein ZapA [Gammaproteobacteria bacterium]|nr:cell division protein ZapA [Gammaproteobacteria bacterium]